MTFEAIIQSGIVLIPPEMNLPDGTIVRVETDYLPAAADGAPPPVNKDEQAESQWRRRRLEELRREVAIGIEQIERGECDEYDANSLRALFDRIKVDGRKRLAAGPQT